MLFSSTHETDFVDGIWPANDAHIADMELSQWQNTLSVDLTGPFLVCRAYLRALRQSSPAVKDTASIIFIGSTAGKFGEANHGDYASAKAAMMYGLTPTLKNEIVTIAPKGRVNSVNPGWVATPLAAETLKDTKFVERALATTPLQKVGRPEDIARQIAVVASPTLSGHVNGVNLQVGKLCVPCHIAHVRANERYLPEDGGMEGRLLYPPQT